MTEQQKLEEAIKHLKLDPFCSVVLKEIALDPHGLEMISAPSVLASLVCRPLQDCNTAIVNLSSQQFLTQVTDDGRSWLVANYQKLGIDEETRHQLLHRASPFKTLGAPHSPNALHTLDSLFLEKEPIYLGLEITSHRVFRHLEERARNQLLTVFLLPKKSALQVERHRHYDEVLQEWMDFINKGSADVKKFTRIRNTNVAMPHLYTSSLTADHVRFDMYLFKEGERTTRTGVMVEAQHGSSLYEVVYREYCDAVYSSLPIFSLWPAEWLGCYAKRFGPSIAGLMIASTLSWIGGSVLAVIAALVFGISGNAIYDSLRERVWDAPELYKRQ